MAQEVKRPEFVEGGCHCRSLRWKLSFPTDTQYPPVVFHCHCATCRKTAGAFLATFISAPVSQLTWTSKSTFKEYNSSEFVRRGFCEKCGCGVTYRNVNDETAMSMTVASIDEEILNDEEIGFLTNPGASYCASNIIKGLDDGVKLTTAKFIMFGPETIEEPN